MDTLVFIGRGALLLFAAGIAAALLPIEALLLPLGVWNPFAAVDGIELSSVSAPRSLT